MGIVLGLAAALFWGAADFIARGVTRQIGTTRTLYYMQFVGLGALGAYLILTGELVRLLPAVELEAWLLALLVAILIMFASLALYRGFEIGMITVVSPIAAAYAAITVILSVLSGEVLSPSNIAGIAAALGGVVLASVGDPPPEADGRRRIGPPPGVGLAIGAAIGYGVAFWLIGFYITPTFGSIVPVWITRLMTILMLLLLASIARRPLTPPKRAVWRPIIAVGVLDTAAYVANNVGLLTEQVSIVTVLASLFTAVTVLLARVFLNERLRRSQWLGIGCILLGIVLVSL